MVKTKGYPAEDAKAEVERVNNQFNPPLPMSELKGTIFKTIDKESMKREINGDSYIEDDDDDDYYEEDEFYKVDK